jgi:hypothetical protein
MVVWPYHFWPALKQNIIAGNLWWGKAVDLMVAQEREGGGEEGPGSQYPLQEHVHSDLTSFY